MAARRCSRCCLSWPTLTDYKVCPSCEEKTDWVANDTAMTRAEAKSLASHAEFARYYETTRGVPVDDEGDPALDPLRKAVSAIEF